MNRKILFANSISEFQDLIKKYKDEGHEFLGVTIRAAHFSDLMIVRCNDV